MFSRKWPKNPIFFSLINIRKTMSTKKNSSKRELTLDGMMTFGKLETGLRTLDFMCCEDAEMEAFEGTFRVQGMRDGNVYMTERKRRVRNKPIFREDNSSLSLGQDGRYYFYFALPQELLDELPEQLIRQAMAIALKVASPPAPLPLELCSLATKGTQELERGGLSLGI